MIWHGCRHGRSRQLAPVAVQAGLLALCAVTAAGQLQASEPGSAVTALPGFSSTAEPSAVRFDRRIELHWHCKSPRRWAGTVQLVESAADAGVPAAGSLIADPVNLTPGPSLSGGMLQIDSRQLRFGPPSRLPMLPHGEGKLTSVSSTSGGIAFRVHASADQRLVVRLDGDDLSPAWTTEIDLAELDNGAEVKRAIDSQATLTSRRLAGDMFRFRLGNSGTVFWTDEVVDLTVDGTAAGLPSAADGDLVLQCQAFAASDQTLVASQMWPARIVAGRVVLEDPRWTTPSVEGAYRVRWQLRTKSQTAAVQTQSRSPLALANSFTQSLSGALPASFSPPFQLPLGQSLSLMGGSEQEPLFQTEFSVAVVAEQVTTAPPSPARADLQNGRWQVIGKAEPPDTAMSVSRLLPRQTTDWLAAASVTPGGNKVPTHEGKRLTVIQPQAQLEYAVPLSRVGQRHRALIRMPASSANQIAVELIDGSDATADDVTTSKQLGQGLVITHSELSSESGLWRLASVDFWPRSINTRILISNPSAVQPALFESIEIQVDEGEPAERNSAAQPAAARLAAMRLELSDFLQQFGDRGTPTLASPLDYQAVWVAGNRLIEMLNREGYGGVLLTVASDGAFCYPTELASTDASWNANWASAGQPVDALELLMRLFDRASLTLVPCVRPSSPLKALEQAIASDSGTGPSIAAPSPLGGKLGNWSFDGPPITSFGIYNPKHPAVAEQVGALMGELRRRCDQHRCVSTIGVIVDERTYLRLPPVAITDPQTLDDFHASLGPSAPPRATIAQWIQQGGAAAYENWRMDQAEAIFRKILQQLDDQALLVMSLDSALPSNLVELGRHPRILTARLHRRSLIEPLGLRIRDEACNASVPISAGPSKTVWSHDVGIFHQPVTELRRPHLSSSANPSGAPSDAGSAQQTASFTPLLDPLESSLALAQLLNRSDRMMVAVGGGAINQAGSEIRRRSLRCFSQLPPVSMEDLASDPGMISAVRVRRARYGGDTYIYASNQTHWHISLDMSFSRGVAIIPLGRSPSASTESAPAAKPAALAAGGAATGQQGAAATRWNPTLAPGELAAIRVSGEDVEVLSWKAALAGQSQDFAHIRNYVQEAASSLTRFVEPTRLEAIQNSGFEQAATEGIPGWLTAQYPPGCVAIDSTVAFEGKQSVRLTGQPGHAGGSWMVSQVITPPDSCRIAVSMRLRGERSEAARSLPPLVVRVALEGTVAGTPIRKTKSITVPRDGNWSEPAHRLEIALLPSVPVESLRLTIDLMSGGVVWVDDVSFYDRFVTSGEKTQLDHLVYLAAGGASRGDWTGASRLLDSHWVHDLASARSPVLRDAAQQRVESEAAQAVHQIDHGKASGAAASTPAAKKSPPSGQPTGIGERLKSWLPRPVRF